MKETNNGQEFLKVTGVLMLLCGGITLILSILGICGIGFLDANISTAATLLQKMFIVALSVTCISCLLWIFAGVLGILYSESTEKAYLSVIFGSIVIFFSLASVALHICANGIGWLNMVGLVLALILNGFYLYGAILRFMEREKDSEKKQHKKDLRQEKKMNKAAMKEMKKKPKITATS